MDIATDVPTKLQNIAFWDYWENTDWASRYPGGATRVLLVLSIGSGWIWFIPLGATRTSIGYVCPREFYRASERNPEEMYLWALQQEPLIAELTANASRSGEVRATRDWSFVADRVAGENWLLVGEAAGFADPILAAGMTLTQTAGREAAYSLLALIRGEHDPAWLLRHYDRNQRSRISQHIRFADFWYSANGVFTDLQNYAGEIARDAGLDLDPQKAFQWLGTGGFTDDVLGQVGIGGLDLAGAEQEDIPAYDKGQIKRVRLLVRGRHRLPMCGLFAAIVEALGQGPDLVDHLLPALRRHAERAGTSSPHIVLHHLLQALELMLNQGWVRGERDPRRPGIDLSTPDEGSIVHINLDLNVRLQEYFAKR